MTVVETVVSVSIGCIFGVGFFTKLPFLAHEFEGVRGNFAIGIKEK